MTMLTLGQAARLTGLGKTTLARAIKAGRLSATRTDLGSYQIDAAELHRVYPYPAPGTALVEAGDATGAMVARPGGVAQPATPDATSAALAAEVASLREVAAIMREQVRDLKEDRDRWRDQAERLAALPPPRPQAERLSLWRWLRTTGCLASVGVLLALATVGAAAQQQQPQCFRVVMNHDTSGGSLGAILVDQCTGNTWQLIRTALPSGAQTMRWFPITVETAEVVIRGPR